MNPKLRICVKTQTATLCLAQSSLKTYRISTAKNGVGEAYGSGCTPRGKHIIRAMIGADCPLNSVFVGRRPTGEIYSQVLRTAYPDRDWILTRILWLSGQDIGYNRLGAVDSMRRYIYLHGTPASEPMGIPLSHGCIRMWNEDIVDLFNQVAPGTQVYIE